MKTKPTDKPGFEKVQVTLTINQLRILDRLVSSDLDEAETFGESMATAKDLQKLCDVLWSHLYVPLTPEELAKEQADARERNIAASTAYEESLRKTAPEAV